MTPRVLLLSPTAKPGGAERGLAALARRLPDFGVEPEAIVLEQGPLEEWLREAGCPTRVLTSGRLRQIPKTMGVVRAVHAEIRSHSAEVVLSSHAKGHLYGGLASVAAGIPAVWWQHGFAGRTLIDRVAAAIPAAAVVCYNDEAVSAQTRSAKRRRVVKIHGGVPVADVAARRGSGAAVRRARGWEGSPVVGIVGRLQPWKGQELFLEAASRVAKLRPDARYAVVGGAILGWEGDYPERLRQLSRELGLGDRVHFAGHQADPYPWMDAMDVFVHASFGEPFGLVLVEAMALGKPLVATAFGGPTEIVQDRLSGMLVPPGRPEAMADAILAILGRPDLAASLGQGAVKRAGAFSEERMAESFATLLQRVLNHPPVGARRCPREERWR